ncbi:PucR family transcriptional regulator [Nocardia puris]|uniref:PucR-like helix-turn-helix protein n=1 Tax=Nocardia puris TaxID=208602 RepID=A0A366D0H8_9NOCA|nr:helix-turn-helix domain-containing protein [Nocardia puris]RBO82964.1 PucR-like helix-turn-helix protein [Nocardia puris]
MTIQSINRPAPVGSGNPIAIPPHEVHEMARQLVAGLKSSGTPCGSLPADAAVVARVCLDRVIDRMNGSSGDGAADALHAAAAGWARDGIPIDVALHVLHRGFTAALELILGRVRAAGQADVVACADAILHVLDAVTAAVGKAYVREHKAAAAEHHTAVHNLTSALLGGNTSSSLARESGLPVADRYHVLAVSLPPHSDECDPRLDGRVVARRKLRRVQASLADQFGDRVLSLLSVNGGTVLFPANLRDDREVDDVVRQLSDAARVPVIATLVTASAEEVAGAAQQAHELLDMLERLGGESGLHRFSDLALYYQLTRPGTGREALRAHLAPLDDHPELLTTLRDYLDHEHDRRRTARHLHVHPNTVDYRLRRIAQLTGLDPGKPDQIWILRSAMAARAAEPVPEIRSA